MKTRINKIRKTLESLEGRVMVAWHSPYLKGDSFVNLESSFLTVAGLTSRGDVVVVRYAGTLEQNEIKHQRALFEGETLVRIKNGSRTNLVVKPSHLRYEETAVPAGIRKLVEYGPEPRRMYHTRDGDIGLLRGLERLIANPSIRVRSVPCPTLYKKVREDASIEPRITGELVTALKELPDWNPDEPVTEAFRRNKNSFCFERDGSFFFQLSQVNGRGLTVLDFSSVLNETYEVEPGDLDYKSEVVRLDLSRAFEKDPDRWTG